MAVIPATAAPLSACRALVPYSPRTAELAAAAAHDVVVTPHPLTLQGQTIARAARMLPGESLAGLLARHGVDLRQPGWVVQVGGMEVPAALCSRTRVRPGMLIEARRVPGKSVIRLVALLALAYFTLGPGGLVAGSSVGGVVLGKFGAYALNVGSFMLGSMIINKVLPPPGQGSYGGAQPGATYSLQGARNGARQFGPLGLLFGQVRVAPDFAALPYSWFEGDDQIQYVQLHAGLNVHTVDALQIGETPIESYSDVQVTRTGFASGNTAMTGWESVDTVAGGLLDAPTAPGAYVERNSSPNAIMLQVDLVGQLQYVNSKGSPERFTCNVDIEYRLLPAGAWQPFVGSAATVQLANSTTKPLRRTMSRGVPAGQYAVRMRKVTKNETRSQAANVIEWGALKSYQVDFGTAVARQVVAIRIRASGQLNGTLDQVTWMATSTPSPVWNGSDWVTQTTSNPGALILQFARGVFAPDGRLLWGYGKPDSQIDIEGLKAFMVHCTAQGYRFDHWFTEAMSRRAVLDAIAAAGLASISRHTGKLGVVYMAAGQPIEAIVNMGNIKRGSFRVDYATRTTAEEIEVASPERTNAWRPASLRVLAPGVTVPRETARISPAGITTQAGRLLAARALMAQNIYGRKSVSWEMDLEHLTVRRWSVVALSHDLTQWGYGGRLHSLSDTAGTITIELDAEVPAGSTPHVGLRLPGETAYRVFAVVPFSGTAHTLTLASSWPVGVAQPGATADNPAMDTLWVFDFKATPGQRLRITDIAPTPDLSGARITAVPEPDDFWTFMASGAYTAPVGIASTQPVVVSDLKVTQGRLTLSYDLTAELAVTFAASGPFDHAQVWGAAGDDPLQLLGETRTTRFSGWRVANVGTVQVEVRPFDALGRPGAVLPGTHTVVLDAPLVPQGNLLPVGELVAGLERSAGDGYMVGSWRHISQAGWPVGPHSRLLIEIGPDGQAAVIWRSFSGTGGEAQGGFGRLPFDAVDRAVAYRFALWVRVSGDTSGQIYLGCQNVESLAGVPDANPYFFSVARNTLQAGRWYLAVGYVQPVGFSGAGGLSGLWDAVTGQKVLPGVDYRWAPDALGCDWRAYQYYTTAAGAITDMAAPMVHKVDGTEPSVAALLAMSARGRVAWLTASSQVFAISKTGTVTPSTITLTAQAQNLAGSPNFAVTSGTATLDGSGSTRTLAFADMATDSVTVQMTWSGITDTITIAKVREGGDAVVGLLTNEAHTVATAADGSGASYTNAGGFFKVFQGTAEVTSGVVYSRVYDSNCTVSINATTGEYTVSGLAADVGTAGLRATYGSLIIDKVYSISRSRAGAAGATGDSTQVEYSVDGSTGWHSTFTTGDIYMRQRVGSGAWSAAIRIVGESGLPGDDGSYVDYVFRRSATPPATPTGSSGVPSDWWADPPAADGNPLYMSKATKDGAGNVIGTWSAPVRLEGAAGTPAISSSLSRLVANFTADSTGEVDAGQTFPTTMVVLAGSTDDTSNWSISRSSSHASITTTLAGATVTITGIGTSVESGTVTVTATRSGYPTQNIVVQVGKLKRATPNAGPVALLGSLDVSAYAFAPADATARVRFMSDGRILRNTNGGGSVQIGSWYLPNTAGIGSQYEARADAVSVTGSTTGVTTNTVGSWNALSTDREIQVQRTENTPTLTIRVYSVAVRRVSDGVQVSAGTIYMECATEA